MLPIEEIIAPLRQTLQQHTCALLQAEPGAGKTTRVPLALVDESWLAGRKILMLEPRRLAAVSAARYMSCLLGEPPGHTVGYVIRHERMLGPQTRIEVVTEGILTRRLQHDPLLEDVGLIIFDEFHERNLHSDVGLALSYDVQQGVRPDLRLLLMSATLDSAGLSASLDQCPVLHSRGRSYPVSISYHEDDGRPLEHRVSKAVSVALNHSGDILVFLPGAGMIRRCAAVLQRQGWAEGLQILPLYGALPYEQQQRVLQPASGRKVILATNIAETSLTIDGVGVVIDSGLERRLMFDPARGMNRLPTRRISQASAVQRAGRAGRQGPGHCIRLWSETTQHGLELHQRPEIMRSDLSAMALELAAWGITDATRLRWIDLPPQPHVDAAFTLLEALGAVDHERRLTTVGRNMAEIPLHPRLARMLVAADTPAEQALACRMAVILDNPHLFRWTEEYRPVRGSSPSDMVDILEQWHGREKSARRVKEVQSADRHAFRNLYALERHLGLAKNTAFSISAQHIAPLLLAAFPDRVARRRESSRERYQLCNGTGAYLSPRSRMQPADWLVALDLEQRQGADALIHMASSLDLEQILAAFPVAERWSTETLWDTEAQRVVTRRCRRIGALILQQQPHAVDVAAALALMLEQVRSRGLEVLSWTPESEQLYARMRFVAAHKLAPDWPQVDDQGMLTDLEHWLGPWLGNVTSLARLKQVDLRQALFSMLTWEQQQQLDSLAPARLEVPSGSRVRIDYTDPEQPHLAVKLQELFGWDRSPRIGGGRVVLVLELLSPAQRPIQVTTDLANFWDQTYAEVKKELKGRYPKHPWPDNPRMAVPRRGVRRR